MRIAGSGKCNVLAERSAGGQRRCRRPRWDIGRGRHGDWLAAWSLSCVCTVGAFFFPARWSRLVAVQHLRWQNTAQTDVNVHVPVNMSVNVNDRKCNIQHRQVAQAPAPSQGHQWARSNGPNGELASRNNVWFRFDRDSTDMVMPSPFHLSTCWLSASLRLYNTLRTLPPFMCTNILMCLVVSLLSMCRARALYSSHFRSSACGVQMNAQHLRTCGNSGSCEQFLKCPRHQTQLEGTQRPYLYAPDLPPGRGFQHTM